MRRLLLSISIAYTIPAVTFAYRPQLQEQASLILFGLAASTFAAAWLLHVMHERGRAAG